MSVMSYTSIDGLEARLDHGILRFTLDRPAKRNALDDTMVGALIDHLDRANQDETVRAILLDSSSDDFCTGFDVISRNADTPSRGVDAPAQKPRVGSIQRRVPSQAHRLIPLMLSTQVPIICAVRGWAAGLGFHLALASDFCIAARDARFWEPFTERGFTPDSGGTWLLPRLVGMARAKELLLLGTELSGEDAASWGLVHRAVDADDTSSEAGLLARRLADGPTVALGLTKWLLHQGAGLDLERHLANEALALELSSRSSDFREGMTALREKREPGFEGR
jgi:2-(1,2-epoxy-1,2-dihydrophenyl)acetyl-CoA isomerase